MGRPDGIPDDVWAAALAGVSAYHQPRHDPGLQSCFAEAIMAERGRCLRIARLYAEGLAEASADSLAHRFVHEALVGMASSIAASIEAGDPA